jgi:hypothetical protein
MPQTSGFFFLVLYEWVIAFVGYAGATRSKAPA